MNFKYKKQFLRITPARPRPYHCAQASVWLSLDSESENTGRSLEVFGNAVDPGFPTQARVGDFLTPVLLDTAVGKNH
jgi:hypothetical protein